MRRFLSVSFALVLLTGCQAPVQVERQARPAAASATRSVSAAPQILIKFKPGMRAAALTGFRAQFGTRNVDYIAGLDVYVEELTARLPIQQALADINASPLVEYAELNGEVGLVP